VAELRQLCEEMKSICKDAEQATMLEGRARDSAKQGFQALSDVETTLNNFVDSSGEIDELLMQIQLLTQQVHILGVNAAIEAANAGEQGSGFSIIASEMRRIAGKVKSTAGSIQEILEVSGSLANNTVTAIEAASEELELLEVSADLSIELMTSVSDRIRKQYSQIDQIVSGDEVD